ncbi:MAG: ergothioneine biosynthesis protein EgtB [Acidobacteriota bacterium]|nr:ergothioneine biosynthesis protein EgtB [Acidobacteriota bacterium]
MANQLAETIADEMLRAREETLALFDLARESDLHESPGFGFRPIIWHLAHIGVFEAYWLLQRLKGEPSPDERYERIFDPIKTPREESKDLPTRAEMGGYLARVRDSVLLHLERTEFDESDPLLRDGYIFRLVLEHEHQHQETLLYLLHLLDPSKKARPSEIEAIDQEVSVRHLTKGEMVTVDEGPFVMGAAHDSFAYDNERPPHAVHVPAFRIDKYLTTNEEYAEFIAEGGYRRREFWSDEGWARREQEGWRHPLYWREADGVWLARTMFEEGTLRPHHPVVGISWYEAEAYARFRRKRLPSEAEWEKAAAWDAGRESKSRYSWGDRTPSTRLCNFDNRFWGTTPVGSFPEGASLRGCLDMSGNAWEWTNDEFRGYPGFEAFPYPEYSEVWFDGDHRVLRGGSWATRASVLRTSFRNFFRRHFRIAFAGVRCALDCE